MSKGKHTHPSDVTITVVGNPTYQATGLPDLDSFSKGFPFHDYTLSIKTWKVYLVILSYHSMKIGEYIMKNLQTVLSLTHKGLLSIVNSVREVASIVYCFYFGGRDEMHHQDSATINNDCSNA